MLNSDSSETDFEVVETWQRFMQGLLGVLALVGALLMAHYYAPPETAGLEQQVHQLTRQVADMQEQRDLQQVLQRDQDFFRRDGRRCPRVSRLHLWHLSRFRPTAEFRARVAGTGFVVAPGLLATNRHVAEPWFGDREVAVELRQGGLPVLEKLEAYFPDRRFLYAWKLQPSRSMEIWPSFILKKRLLRVNSPVDTCRANPARSRGIVSVLAYPMGVTGMVAKSPALVYERLSSHPDNAETAGELAALSLIRPSATFGHIGDVSGDKLIYDAPTARGGSGGPVLNLRGEVVGINCGLHRRLLWRHPRHHRRPIASSAGNCKAG